MQKSPSIILIGEKLPSGLPRSKEFVLKEIQGIVSEIDDLEDMYEEMVSRDDLTKASQVDQLIESLIAQQQILERTMKSYYTVDEWQLISE